MKKNILILALLSVFVLAGCFSNVKPTPYPEPEPCPPPVICPPVIECPPAIECPTWEEMVEQKQEGPGYWLMLHFTTPEVVPEPEFDLITGHGSDAIGGTDSEPDEPGPGPGCGGWGGHHK